MNQPNYRLKGLIITQYGAMAVAARTFGIREDRLSRIVHDRVTPTREEKREISWRLQKKISELWPSEG